MKYKAVLTNLPASLHGNKVFVHDLLELCNVGPLCGLEQAFVVRLWERYVDLSGEKNVFFSEYHIVSAEDLAFARTVIVGNEVQFY